MYQSPSPIVTKDWASDHLRMTALNKILDATKIWGGYQITLDVPEAEKEHDIFLYARNANEYFFMINRLIKRIGELGMRHLLKPLEISLLENNKKEENIPDIDANILLNPINI